MKKRILSVLLVLIMFLMLLMLSGCRSSSLSGRFINQGNATEYLEFTGGRNVVLVSGNNTAVGRYRLNGSNLIITFNHGGFLSDERLNINSRRNVITYHGITFVSEGRSGLPWWGWGLIILIGFGVISHIYQSITKRPLEDDLDKLGENIERYFDKQEDGNDDSTSE